MKNILPEEVILEILKHELELPDYYGKDNKGFIIPSIYIYAPNINLGNTEKMQVCIQSIGSQVVFNQSHSKTINGLYSEIQEVMAKDSIQIDIFSRNDEAKIKRYQVISALNSIYSKQKQDEYAMKIYYIPSRMNQLNAVEGSAKIYRYSVTVDILHKKEYTKSVDYYDKFNFEASIDDLANKQSFKIPD